MADAAVDDLRQIHLALFKMLDADPMAAGLVAMEALHEMRDIGVIDSDPDRRRVMLTIVKSATQLIEQGAFPRTPPGQVAHQTEHEVASVGSFTGPSPAFSVAGNSNPGL